MKLIRTILATAMLQLLAPGLLITARAADVATAPAHEHMTPIDAWPAVAKMTPGINIGNTLENTAHWETGWGNPPITKEYVQSLARAGFKSVRLPVAWDTYSDHGRITPEQFRRVGEVVNWITDAGMFCVLNIHWDGGWINSGDKVRFPKTYHTFSPEAQSKFISYWKQIAEHFAGKNEKLIFEGLNEESDFSNEGFPEKAFAALTHANQLFINTVRRTGGNNANRLLVISGYETDFAKTCRPEVQDAHRHVRGKLFISIHYYTPWTFVGLNEDASWGKMQSTWGSAEDVKLLNDLFDQLHAFCQRNNCPAFIGEFSMCSNKGEYGAQWTNAVAGAAVQRKMVPVLWDTGGGMSRREPYAVDKSMVERFARWVSNRWRQVNGVGLKVRIKNLRTNDAF